jgi:hypothetical protein
MGCLLILSCSQRKSPRKGRLPAIDRYDGPAFRVLRKFLKSSQEAPVVLILSAKHGLIESAKGISDYDCRISATLAKRLRPTVIDKLGQVLQSATWRCVGLCVGKGYRAALDGMELLLPESTHVEVLGGGLGRRLTALKAWLYRGAAVDGKGCQHADQET